MTMLGLVFDILKMVAGIIIPTFREQPRVHFSYTRGQQGNRGGAINQIECEWNGSLELYNETPHTALAMRFVWPVAGPQLPLTLRDLHLPGLERKTVAFKLTKLVWTQDVPQGVVPYQQFRPPELDRFSLLLEYKNERGKHFYTHFEVDHANQNNSFLWRVPKQFHS